MILRYARRAREDFATILDRVERQSPAGAASLSAAFQASLNFILMNPDGGLRTARAGLRVKIVPKYPYKIFYRRFEDAIEIAHVRHASRRPWVQ